MNTKVVVIVGIGSFGRAAQGDESDTVVEEPEVEDDAQTKFYKQHMVKSQPPDMADRTTARDFDKWAVDRITESFEHKKRVRELIREREQDINEAESRDTFRGVICIGLVLILLISNYLQSMHTQSHDAEMKKLNEKKS